MYQWVKSESSEGVEWLLRRNCVLSPKRLALMMAIAAFLSLFVATSWAVMGVWWVFPFAIIESLGLLIAFFVYSKHAVDLDRIVVGNEKITVETVDGGKRSMAQYPVEYARVAYTRERKSLVQLRVGAADWRIGRFVPEGQREALAKEIAGALGVRLAVR